MTLSLVANLADLLAALGVMASLLLLAWETRKGSEQSRMANWNAVLTALREQKRRTDDLTLADVLYRGRQDFAALSGAEAIAFGYWMEEWIQCQEGLLIYNAASAHRHDELRFAARRNFDAMFAFPGCRAWWQASGLAGRWPKSLVAEVDASIDRQTAAAQSGMS